MGVMRSVFLVVAVVSLIPAVVYADDEPKPEAPLMAPTPAPMPAPCPKFAAAPTPAPTRYILDDRAPAARRDAKWFAIAGGVLWLTSSYYAYRVQQDYNDFAIDREVAKSRMTTASVLFMGGTALLGTSAYLYFVLGKKQPAVAPVFGRDRVGVAMERRF
jgi:hypothetical protein